MSAPRQSAASRIGQRFGRLVVESIVRRDTAGHAYARALCDCGKQTVTKIENMVRGDTRSCGCLSAPQPLAEQFEQYVDRSGGPDACWLWTRTRDDRGYGRIYTPTRQRSERAHRIAYELAHGPITDGMSVCHHCDNPPCCNPAHLFLGTHSDNMRDMVAKGRDSARTKPERCPRGECHGSAKLTETKVREIRRRYAAGGVSQSALASEYGVTQWSICMVTRGRSWAHIPMEAT